MDHYSYYIIVQQEKETGKNYAYTEKVSNCYNLYNYFQAHKGCKITSINACKTMKEAKKISDFWNECYKKNGTYAF